MRPSTAPAGATVLVLGGARSGKSAFAERIVLGSGLDPVYVATARAGDEEMARRIACHQARRDPRWRTVEEPLHLPELLAREAASDRAVLVDCLTLWLTNVLLSGTDPEPAVHALEDRVAAAAGMLVMVSNEVGLGVVPADPLSRRFVDLAGTLHQRLARRCRSVVLVTAGLPLSLKGEMPASVEG